ncbi:putative ribonuclease H-like domain-containing protein [Tanacetum coccineum]
MTGNKSYLTDYEEINGGFVAFGGNFERGKITEKGKIRTGKLDFEDVYFVKELQFNLFSVSQMCDKNNRVLFTDTECVVLSPDFKLTDESHVLLKVPRKDNMYSVDLKNVVPQEGLTCLFAKATPDESNLWPRRLGHVNFKTLNKLVRGNLVRGLPSKIFEINQTCVACQKGKQHRDFYKTKTVSSIRQPLQMLHMDLFGPTFVKSLMKKMYCLVVTDNYSRFSWVFFLATKDETSEILETFITGIENLIDLRVKVIRCDNRTEFKNRIMNQFCEMKGSGPKWLFDIDTLTNSMNYNQVVAGNQSNGSVGTKVYDSTGKARVETVPGKEYILLPLWTQDPPFSSSSKDSPDAGFKPLGEEEKKDAEDLRNEDGEVPSIEEPIVNQEKDANVNNTNNINIVSPTDNATGIEDNAVDENIVYGCADDQNMPELEDIVYSDDDEDVGAKADMNNLDTFMPVSSIPTTRIHKDHPVAQIIRDLNSAPQTRRMTKNLEEHGLFSSVLQRTNHKDFQNYLFACFLSQEESKKVVQVLKDPSWIEAMQEELLQFKLQEVWTLVELPNGKRTIGTKWVFRKKKDERGLQVKQKEDGIFISQDKYVNGILNKFGFSDVKTASTPMETHKTLLKDEKVEDVDEHLYRSMIGAFMYLTSSRLDIMFAVCACARFQVNPKISHLHAVKRIFRYLKGQPKLGLWYPKDSPFDLVAYTDSDYAGAILDRKSIIGGCQFLSGNAAKDGIGVKTGNSRVNAAGRNLVLLGKIWSTAKIKTVNNEKQIHAKVEGKRIVIPESSVRRDLQFDDENGIACLTNTKIFENLQLMGYEKLSEKLTFYKPYFSPQWKYLIYTILQYLSSKSTDWNEFSTNIASAVICLAKNQKFNFYKLIFDGMMRNLDSSKKFVMYPRFLQLFLNNQIKNLSEVNAVYDRPSHTKKIFANMRRQGKDFSGTVTPLFSSMLAQQADMGEWSRQPTDPQHTPTSAQPSNKEPITIPSSSQPKKTFKRRKPKKVTEIPQSSEPTTLVADKAIHEERGDSVKRDATTATSLDAEQDSGNINRTQFTAMPNDPLP